MVRSRAVEWSAFAAAGILFLFLLGLALQGPKALAAGGEAGLVAAAYLGLGLWSRRKRRREQRHRLLP